MGYVTFVPPFIYIMQTSNNSADSKPARHGQFQEEEKNSDYGIEYFPFQKFIRQKIKNARIGEK